MCIAHSVIVLVLLMVVGGAGGYCEARRELMKYLPERAPPRTIRIELSSSSKQSDIRMTPFITFVHRFPSIIKFLNMIDHCGTILWSLCGSRSSSLNYCGWVVSDGQRNGHLQRLVI